nr:n-acetyltransferase 9-like protein [Quercus suber]
MKINADISLSSAKLLLVPYAASHVPTYHVWMQDPDLQAATASEPLTIDEEYAMQHSWRTDRDKLTFIICLPSAQSSEHSSAGGAQGSQMEEGKDNERENMVGDINLFLFECDDDDDDGDGDRQRLPAKDMIKNLTVGELELMIARTDLQRRGLGRAALLVFIDYVITNWDMIAREFEGTNDSWDTVTRELAYLRVKINTSNHGSLLLFESLGFQQTVAGVNYFGEVELRWIPDARALRRNRYWTEWRTLAYNEPQSASQRLS